MAEISFEAKKGKNNMKIAHVVNYAPGLSGMYNSVRDLVLEERRRGERAEVIDDVNSPIASGTDGIHPVTTAFGDEADIICWHHAMAESWLNEPHRNIVLFLHGTPEFNFFTELYDKDRVLSLLIGAAKSNIPRAFVTMWKRHIPYWENLLRVPVHFVPSWVDLNSWQVSTLKPDPEVIRIGLVDYWRLTREPFGLIAAIERLKKKTGKRVEVNAWGLTDTPNDTYKAVIQWLYEDGTLKIRGNTPKPMEDIYHQNDMILTMSTEETRVVREGMACGVPVVCGRGPLDFTRYSADCVDSEALADVMIECHENLIKKGDKERRKIRRYAEKNFNVRKSGEAVIKIFNDVIEKHGSVNILNGPRMVAKVKDTAEKISARLSAGEPTCYVRFGDGDLILIAGAAGEKFHKNSPELQKELTEAFTHKEEGYFVASVAGQINEGRMTKGLFARFEYDEALRDIVNGLRPNETLDNAIALAYLSVFEPMWFIDFVKKCIHGKRVLFIGGDSLCSSDLVRRVFDVKTFMKFPMSDAYYVLNEKMSEIEDLAKSHDLIICAAGMATRVIAKRLWKSGIRTSFIDIGSIADGIAGISDTRTWLRLVGQDYKRNFEIAFASVKVDIIVLSHGNEDKTTRCFESIAKHTTNYRVIWVDNGSGQESIEKVKPAAMKLADCDLVSIPTNEGFSRGVNRGIRNFIADGKAAYVVLLNNDVVVSDGWLDGLITSAVSSSLDAVGPLTSENNPHSLSAIGSIINDLPAFDKETTDERATVLRKKYGTRSITVNNMLSFFCCLLSKEAIEQIGLLDENIFAYGEDNDYFERARRLNRRFGIALGVYVHHDHGATSSKMGDGWKEKTRKESISYLQKKWDQALTQPLVDVMPSNDKVERVEFDKLHLGCGDHRLGGFVNVDTRKTSATDIVHDCTDLSFLPEKSFSVIFANAFFEHLRRDKHELFIDSAKRCLKDDGVLFIIAVPDFETAGRAYFDNKQINAAKKIDISLLQGWTHGPSHDLDDESKMFSWMHKGLFDKKYIETLLNKADLQHVIFNYCYPGEMVDLNMGFIASKKPINDDQLQVFFRNYKQLIDVDTVKIWEKT